MHLTLLLALMPAVSVLAFPSLLLRSELQDSYDYVVVGGGTGGMTLANRLSEDGTKMVLVIEAGPLDAYEKDIMIPRFYIGASGAGISKYDWNISTIPQPQLNNRSIVMTQGKLIGGGSCLNAMVFDRGTPADYDAWAELGNPGWDFAGLFPYFKRSETFTPPLEQQAADLGITYNPECHGFNGPVQSSFCAYTYPTHSNFLTAMASLGVNRPLDQGCGDSLGAYVTTHSIHPTNQSRSSSRTAYYDPAVGRPNLHVLTEHQVTKLVTTKQDSKVVVTAVEYASSKDATKQTVNVKEEAILSAGALHSPHLLQLSGIGPSSLLSQYGIETLVDLPGVGHNLQDHCVSGTAASDLNNATFDAEQGELYYNERQGRWTDGLPSALAFMPLLNWTNLGESILQGMTPSNAIAYLPDGTDAPVAAGYMSQVESVVKMHRARSTAAQELMYLNGGTAFISIIMHPLSRGTVSLTSIDPFVNPLVDTRYLTHPADGQLLVDAIRYNREIIATEAIQQTGAVEVSPGPEVISEKDLLASVKKSVSTVWHPSGTCAMLPYEQGGVVDPDLMVYGVLNLRVVDASVMPILPGAHMQATIYAIAEKVFF
ncbi:GMC oxidoreductase [Zopfia rhizophila CBS 207.26]|uniref:GMC oxidoreductase n=1 Tax=Zopfia rhizophila CBS 207.26 TaxID=1314779 RepID=A0A6A6DSX2_9PEZI|nr:GMC oxidoreductase [Zopfia rhizophila CBS 207.26]